MRPFDLEAAKRGEPIQTRRGEAVTFIAHCPTARPSNRVIFHYEDGVVGARYENGAFQESQGTGNDLFMTPQKYRREVWVNLYPDGHHYGYESRDIADKLAGCRRLGEKAHHVVIEWDE